MRKTLAITTFLACSLSAFLLILGLFLGSHNEKQGEGLMAIALLLLFPVVVGFHDLLSGVSKRGAWAVTGLGCAGLVGLPLGTSRTLAGTTLEGLHLILLSLLGASFVCAGLLALYHKKLPAILCGASIAMGASWSVVMLANALPAVGAAPVALFGVNALALVAGHLLFTIGTSIWIVKPKTTSG